MLNLRFSSIFLLSLIINRTNIFFAESNPFGKALLGSSYQPVHARMPAHPTGGPNNQPYLLKLPPSPLLPPPLNPPPPHPPSTAASSFSLPRTQIRRPPALPPPPASLLRVDLPASLPPSLLLLVLLLLPHQLGPLAPSASPPLPSVRPSLAVGSNGGERCGWRIRRRGGARCGVGA
jgi:hypothetical protein